MKQILLVLTLLILAGCATGPTTPPESPISIQLKGTAVEVQNFIEQNIGNTHGKRAKDLRITKCNKTDILNTLIIYENNIENLKNVNKRKKLWYYMSELKKDKFMKKYVLWN